MQKPPFIVTAGLPRDLFAFADNLRREHFPPERNQLHAHVTLFHSFAPSLCAELKTVLPRIAGEFAPVPARLNGLMDLGKGTALAIESEGMLNIRLLIADHFHGSLTDQDMYEPRLHITIQNKVSKEETRALQAELGPQLELRDFKFTGLELHIYRGGPWDEAGKFAFRGNADALCITA